MFILAHFNIIVVAVLMAIPFYFFNRYLLQKIKPGESGKNALKYFLVVLITALFYAIIAVVSMSWIAYLLL